MSEAAWWPDEPWWEKRSIVIGSFSFSPRQLGTLLFFMLIGLVVSSAANFSIMGVSAGGKFLVFFLLLLAGYAVASLRVKLVPLELQLVYWARNRGESGGATVRENAASQRGPRTKPKQASLLHPKEGAAKEDTVLEVADFGSAPPLMFSGSARVKSELKVRLYVNNVEREVDTVSPLKPDYRLIYHPKESDIGVNSFEVRLEGEAKPLKVQRVAVSVKGRDMLDSRK